jgi:ArsR family transcriptional regulator, arsenate/arsenite/antimonite-responsive transcriptional repressor
MWQHGDMPTAAKTSAGPLTVLQGCCSPVTGQVLSQGDAEALAGALKALADPARLRLISIIGACDTGEVCVCDLTGPIGLSQPTVSHHLKILVDAGLLTREQRGRWAYYRLVAGALDALSRLIATPTVLD